MEPNGLSPTQLSDHFKDTQQSEELCILDVNLFTRLRRIWIMVQMMDVSNTNNKAVLSHAFSRDEWQRGYASFRTDTLLYGHDDRTAAHVSLEEFTDQSVEAILTTSDALTRTANVMGLVEVMGIATSKQIEASVDTIIVLTQTARAD